MLRPNVMYQYTSILTAIVPTVAGDRYLAEKSNILILAYQIYYLIVGLRLTRFFVVHNCFNCFSLNE